MIKIVQKDNEILRKVAKEVAVSDIGSPKINKILKDMKTALDSQEDGVAIAAPQIGQSLRIFVVTEKVFDIPEKKEDRKNRVKDVNKVYGHIVYINPVITKISKEKSMLEEGCLSVRYAYGKVNRSDKATVKAYNETGKAFTRGASGLMAQIFQHEIDHLDGVLFIDKAVDVKETPPEKIKNND